MNDSLKERSGIGRFTLLQKHLSALPLHAPGDGQNGFTSREKLFTSLSPLSLVVPGGACLRDTPEGDKLWKMGPPVISERKQKINNQCFWELISSKPVLSIFKQSFASFSDIYPIPHRCVIFQRCIGIKTCQNNSPSQREPKTIKGDKKRNDNHKKVPLARRF